MVVKHFRCVAFVDNEDSVKVSRGRTEVCTLILNVLVTLSPSKLILEILFRGTNVYS